MDRKVREHFDRIGRENERLIDEELASMTVEEACRISEAILRTAPYLPPAPPEEDVPFLTIAEMIRRHKAHGRTRRSSRSRSRRRGRARRNGR